MHKKTSSDKVSLSSPLSKGSLDNDHSLGTQKASLISQVNHTSLINDLQLRLNVH